MNWEREMDEAIAAQVTTPKAQAERLAARLREVADEKSAVQISSESVRLLLRLLREKDEEIERLVRALETALDVHAEKTKETEMLRVDLAHERERAEKAERDYESLYISTEQEIGILRERLMSAKTRLKEGTMNDMITACCEAVRRIATVDDKLEGYACPLHGTQWVNSLRWYLKNRSEMKLFEIRDRMTFVPAMGVRVSGADDPLLWRAGFANEREITSIILIHLTRNQCQYDPFQWGDRTMHQAHRFIERNWPSLKNGTVIDVEFILGETASPKDSEVKR